MKLLNYLFKRSTKAFSKEYKGQRDPKGTYYISYVEFKKMQAKIRALFFFILFFLVIILLIILADFPARFFQSI